MAIFQKLEGLKVINLDSIYIYVVVADEQSSQPYTSHCSQEVLKLFAPDAPICLHPTRTASSGLFLTSTTNSGFFHCFLDIMIIRPSAFINDNL